MACERKDPAETLLYRAIFEPECWRFALRDTSYSLNTAVRPPKATGFQYKATTAGHTSADEPRWPKVAGQTVTDGSVVWTAEAISATSTLRTLDSAAWTADTGITLTGATVVGEQAVVLIGGGTEGQDYDVICTGTCSDGEIVVATFTIQVRRPARTVSCAD